MESDHKQSEPIHDEWVFVYALANHLIETGVMDKESFQQTLVKWRHHFEEHAKKDPNQLLDYHSGQPTRSSQVLQSSDGGGQRILLVDDVKFVRDLIRDCLSSQGYTHLLESDSGLEAIELFEEYNPSLVLLDIEMRGMDGLEVFEKIHQMNPNIPVIIMTGNPQHNYVKKAYALGVSDFLAKPLDVNRLLELVQRHLQHERSS